MAVRAAGLCAALVASEAVPQTAVGAEGDRAAAVAVALDDLDAWVGDGANGDRWRSYLKTGELRTELAKSAEANPAVVARVLQQFRGDANGLELAPFRTTADALARWLAELRQPLADDLVRYALAAGNDYAPITAAQFARVRADLRGKARALEQALGADTPLARSWKEYLRWDQLTPHLADDYRPTNASLAELGDVLRRFRTNEPGLELPVFSDVAKAIAKYRAFAPWAFTARDTRPVYEGQLAELSRLLERHGERPTMETMRSVASRFGLVDSLGQSQDFVDAMRRQYAHPNIYGAVSAHLVMRAPNRPIDRVTPVRDCILGTSIFGSAHAIGNIQYNLIPSDDSVELAIYLMGEAHSRTTGRNGPVRIQSSGVTTYWATKQVSLTPAAFISSPATAGAELHSRIHSIRKTGGPIGRRLIEKIAWNRARQQKGQAERISASHTRDRVVREFEETVARDLAAVRLQYENQISRPLARRGVSPEYLRMSSEATGVSVETLFAARSQLGAPGVRPPTMPGHDIVVQIHESAVNNYLPLALASARIAQETAENPPDIKGNVPNWLKALSVARPNLAAAAGAGVEAVEEAQERIEEAIGAEPDVTPPPFKPYSITLNAEAPASIRFDDNRVAIRVRAAELLSEDSSYRDWDFIVTYAIRQEGDRILLTREGDIEAFPTSFDPDWPRQLSGEETGFRSVLKKNMNARAAAGQSFPKQIPIEPVRLSRFGVLVLRELIADDGWLTIGWALP
jgi:hypothetical protein